MSDEHFDAIVVGSGFGGSVMAYRLAESGQNVALLERGKAYPPGSFPRGPRGVKGNFWDPSEGLYGMFNFWLFRKIDSLVASGLGGGSLIYANVLLRKDEKWFVKEDLSKGGFEYWPVERADLEPHYDAVERMMNAQKYPFDHAPFDRAGKTRAMQQAAAALDLPWQLLNLAVTFRDGAGRPMLREPIREEHPNLHGRPRQTCCLCGECDVGCNYGSKNTLDFNYLSEAKRHGAEIRTLAEVRRFEPLEGGGYAVYYVQHDLSREGTRTDTSELPQTRITAKRLVLAAGTLGTTFLLLKNRGAFPRLSARLGTRYCGNGDLLGFTNRADVVMDASYGPVITSAIRGADAEDGDGATGRGFYIEDAGYPEFVNWMLETLETPGLLHRALLFLKRRFLRAITDTRQGDLSAEVSLLLGRSELSSRALPLLGMGRDTPDGRMRLEKGRLDLDWTRKESRAFFDRLRGTMKDIAGVWGAGFRVNPTWYLRRLITVHSLGGCPMGRNAEEGVVNANGQVFDYPGLYVADGAMMPGPVGANPSLTIAALSDRFAERIIEDEKG